MYWNFKMKIAKYIFAGCFLLLAVVIERTQPTCVLESDFGLKLNCAFKKSGLFRVRNLGGIKAHASLGFSLGDELGFDQSLTNLDPSRRRSVNVMNAPINVVGSDSTARAGKQEKRGKQNRIMMRPPAPPKRMNQGAMEKLTTLHRRGSSTMRPIIVAPTTNTKMNKITPTVTMAKPYPLGLPAFRPLPPKEDSLKVVPITATTKQPFAPMPVQSKGPGLPYQSETYFPVSHSQISNMVSQMTASHAAQPIYRITPTPIVVDTPNYYSIPTTMNPFIPLPVAAPPTQATISIIPSPILNNIQVQQYPKTPYMKNTFTIHKPLYPISNFVDPHQVQDVGDGYPAYNTKKVDDYNSITGYGDDTVLQFNKEDVNAKIAELAKAGNISMESVEAAIALRQQQLLSKYANIPPPMTTSPTTTTEPPFIFQINSEPENVAPQVQKQKKFPSSSKVMNAPREYYPVGYEKNFDDHFQSKVDLPETNFSCGDQKYFPGLYGDENLGCMVFHVCALTDDGLVMKSFLCPESTLFDQTILKCNWWFYVDCKNTKRLYDTNIPVSKSYQLMKALTFFSSYNKDMQETEDRPANPEEVAGVKEAIDILQNHDSKPVKSATTPGPIMFITPIPFPDERSKQNSEVSNETHPVYRANRTYKNSSTDGQLSNWREVQPPNSFVPQNDSNSEFRLITVNANFNVHKDDQSSIESSTKREEKQYRRRTTLSKNNSTTTSFTSTTGTLSLLAQSLDVEKQEIHDINQLKTGEVKQEKLTDQIDDALKTSSSEILDTNSNSYPVRRFLRSSAEKFSREDKENNIEMMIINDKPVQIVRPTPTARLVGEFSTNVAAIAKLDEAILGKNTRSKRESLFLVTPRSLTNRQRI